MPRLNEYFTNFEQCSLDDPDLPIVTLIFVQREIAEYIFVWSNGGGDFNSVVVISLEDDRFAGVSCIPAKIDEISLMHNEYLEMIKQWVKSISTIKISWEHVV